MGETGHRRHRVVVRDHGEYAGESLGGEQRVSAAVYHYSNINYYRRHNRYE